MELAKQPEQNQQTAVAKVSQNAIVQTLAVKRFDEVSNKLPTKIKGTFDLPKVREMVLATSEKTVQGFIEFELIKLAERINVSGNLTDGQVEFIARQLVGMYPNETIADFKLCFEGVAVGKYIKQDKIFKLDGTEIGYAMGQYLDEKYEVMEDELMKEKDDLYKRDSQNKDWLQLWKEAVEKTDQEGGVKTTSQNMTYLNHVRSITQKEIEAEGKEKPQKAKPIHFTDEQYMEDRNRRIREYQEKGFREKYPQATEEQVQEYMKAMIAHEPKIKRTKPEQP